MSEHDDDQIRRRMRRAADELERGYVRGRAPAPSPRWARPGYRFVVVGIPVATIALIVALVASQLGGSEPGGSLFRSDGTPTATAEPTEEPPTSGPTPTTPTPPSAGPTETARPDPSDPPRSSPTPAPSRVGGTACSPAPEVPEPGSIRLTVESSKDTVDADGSVAFTVRMRNEGALPVHNERGGQEYDFLVRGPDGDVWLWSHEQAFIQPLISETYEPGEERSFTEEWDLVANCKGAPFGLLPAGTYTVRALWISNGGIDAWWSEPVEFEIR